MANVLLIKGQSQYKAMRYYIDEIEMGFRLAGYNTIVLDGLEEAFSFQMEEIRKTMVIDYIFTCNGIFGNSHNILTDSIYITYLCDHPALHTERLKGLDDRAIVFVCDQLYAKYLKEYFPNIKHVLFVPLSGCYSPKYISYTQREKEVVFTGSYIKPQDIYQKVMSHFDGALKKFAEYMLKDIVQNTKQTLDMCLSHALELTQTEVSKEEFNELVRNFLDIDAYARSYYRDKVIRTLIEHGIVVHVYGNGWENFESKHLKNLIIEKGNSYVAQKAVANAKISLNVMPWFKAGFQERIATAMLSGTVAVTDESQYINENFVDGKELVTYSLDHIDELPIKIKKILEDEDMAIRIADAGEKRAEAEMTWQHRTFEMIEFIKECTGDLKKQREYGNVLQIPYQRQHERVIAVDAIKAIDEILNMIEEIQTYDQMDLCDVKYLYTKFLFLYLRIKANFPEIEVTTFVYDYLMHLNEANLEVGVELLILECKNLQSLFLSAECKFLKEENKTCKYKINKLKQSDAFSQEVLVRKILKNYEKSQDIEILQILETIKNRGFVTAYNQKFTYKYENLTEKCLAYVHYDSEAGMHYVDWNGKKMYYPKGHSKEFVASQMQFVNLEQDKESPHRYLEENFNVCEGDVVIDAGVAEGNFSLDVIEKIKKLYLVECEHEWVEALQKTFEPWKDKVVIIEKMLGAEDDDNHITIDCMVEEDEVNFIKMDVEGAEIDSLKGASGILSKSSNIKCAICAYHKKNAERDIMTILENFGFETTTTQGYMFFKEDIDSWVDGELRRGIVRAIKQ